MFWGVLYFWADTDGFDLFDLALFDVHISPFQCDFFSIFPYSIIITTSVSSFVRKILQTKNIDAAKKKIYLSKSE